MYWQQAIRTYNEISSNFFGAKKHEQKKRCPRPLPLKPLSTDERI